MKYHEDASYLNQQQWRTSSKYLAPFIEDLTNIASDFSLDIHAEKRWPSITLSKRRGELVQLYRLSLNHNYLEDKKYYFEFSHAGICRPFGRKGEAKNLVYLERYNIDQITNTASVLDDIRRHVAKDP